MGKKVLAVDFDSQANLTTCFGVEDTGILDDTIGHLMMAEKSVFGAGLYQVFKGQQIALAGLLSILSTISCTMFLSAKCKDSLTVLLISIVVLLMLH